MQLERPRFRQDLVAEPIEDGHSRFIDVMDPDSGNVFRFYEVEYSLACAMDGERDVPGIMRWAQEELGLTASVNEVKSVISTLGELNFLDGAAAPARPEAQTPAAKPSIWDPPAPAARPQEDDMLGRGVVVGQKRANTPVPGVELGNAGASAPVARAEAKSPAADIELGVGVTTGRARDTVKPKVDDIALGVPGRVDVSVDLSDQVAVSTKDVKEAVRASKVMNAVEIPDDLKNALDSAEGAPAAKPRKPPPTPAKGMPAVDPKVAEKAVAEAKAAEAKAAETARADAAKAATTKAAADAAKAAAKPLPKPVQPEPKAAVQPPPPEMKVSRPLLILLIVVAVGAAVFFVYKFVLDKSSSTTGENEMTAPTKPIEPARPPPPPPAESEKLAASAPMSESIKPVAAGTIEMIAGPDAKVKEGETLVRFTGAKALDTEIAALDKDIEQRVKAELTKAEQARDAAVAAGNKTAQATAETQLADRQKSLDDKQGKLASKKSDRDKLEIKSPGAGTFTAKAKVAQKVTPTDELGTLVRAPTKTVTFKKADAGPKSRVILVTKDGKKLACVVTSADAAGVAIECPQDAAADGTLVTFGGVDTSPTPTPDAGSASDAGSGAGSSAAVPSPAPTRPPARPAPVRSQPKTPPPPADKGSDTAAPPPADPAAGSGSSN